MSFGIPAESDMFYEDGVLRSTTTARTYGGIDRNQDLEPVKGIAERTGIAEEVRPRLEDYVSIPVVSPAVYEVLRRALDEAKAKTGAAPILPQDTKHGARTIASMNRFQEDTREDHRTRTG